MRVHIIHLATVHQSEQLEFSGKIDVWLNTRP